MAITDETPLRPTNGHPEFIPREDYDIDDFDGKPIPPTLESVGWDLSFGSRINFGVIEDGTGDLYVDLQLSDDAVANGMVIRSVTREQVLAFAQHLLDLVGARPVLTLPEPPRVAGPEEF